MGSTQEKAEIYPTPRWFLSHLVKTAFSFLASTVSLMVSWPEPVLMVSVTTSALSSSSSLSEPPEELLSEATSGAFLVTQTFQTQGEAALTERSKQLALHNQHHLRNHSAARPRQPGCKQSVHTYCEFWDKGFCADPALTAHSIVFVRKEENTSVFSIEKVLPPHVQF